MQTDLINILNGSTCRGKRGSSLWRFYLNFINNMKCKIKKYWRGIGKEKENSLEENCKL